MDGILVINKEKGYTSHDVVACLRGIFKQKKIGHTGTLDPDATGVLPICLGKATKLSGMLTGKDKTYKAGMRLGMETDTLDITGTVTATYDVKVTQAQVYDAVLSFLGGQFQAPPMYSAIKINGQRLYKAARRNEIIDVPKRKITIYEISQVDIAIPYVSFSVTCSKGTYIRSLCSDIGRKLGCGGVLCELQRTRCGRFDISHAMTLDMVKKAMSENIIADMIIPIDACFEGMDCVICLPQADRLLKNGGSIPLSLVRPENDIVPRDSVQFRMYDSNGMFCATYVYRDDKGTLVPEKMFV